MCNRMGCEIEVKITETIAEHLDNGRSDILYNIDSSKKPIQTLKKTVSDLSKVQRAGGGGRPVRVGDQGRSLPSLRPNLSVRGSA